MTLLIFFSFPQGETKLKISLDRTAPMITTVEFMALPSSQMHLFCQIIRMRVSVISLDFGSSYFVAFYVSLPFVIWLKQPSVWVL